MNETPWFIYILECCDGSYYTGITNNIEERVNEHNSGKGAKYTSVRRPVKLIYKEEYEDKFRARNREVELKGWSRVKKEKLIGGFLRP